MGSTFFKLTSSVRLKDFQKNLFIQFKTTATTERKLSNKRDLLRVGQLTTNMRN